MDGSSIGARSAGAVPEGAPGCRNGGRVREVPDSHSARRRACLEVSLGLRHLPMHGGRNPSRCWAAHRAEARAKPRAWRLVLRQQLLSQIWERARRRESQYRRPRRWRRPCPDHHQCGRVYVKSEARRHVCPAVDIERELAATDGQPRPVLARVLISLANALDDVAERSRAVDAAREASEIHPRRDQRLREVT